MSNVYYITSIIRETGYGTVARFSSLAARRCCGGHCSRPTVCFRLLARRKNPLRSLFLRRKRYRVIRWIRPGCLNHVSFALYGCLFIFGTKVQFGSREPSGLGRRRAVYSRLARYLFFRPCRCSPHASRSRTERESSAIEHHI